MAYLKVMGGKSRGRVIRLTGAVTRFGKTGSIAVMISRRNNGYYLSHLEGEALALVNHAPRSNKSISSMEPCIPAYIRNRIPKMDKRPI